MAIHGPEEVLPWITKTHLPHSTVRMGLVPPFSRRRTGVSELRVTPLTNKGVWNPALTMGTAIQHTLPQALLCSPPHSYSRFPDRSHSGLHNPGIAFVMAGLM